MQSTYCQFPGTDRVLVLVQMLQRLLNCGGLWCRLGRRTRVRSRASAAFSRSNPTPNSCGPAWHQTGCVLHPAGYRRVPQGTASKTSCNKCFKNLVQIPGYLAHVLVQVPVEAHSCSINEPPLTSCRVAYEVTFSEYGEPGFSHVFARFTARKHGGLISYFQMSRDDYGVLYLVN